MTPEEERALAITELGRVADIEAEYPSASYAECRQMIEELKGMMTLDTSDLIDDIELQISRDEVRILTPEERRRRGLDDGQDYGLSFGGG